MTPLKFYCSLVVCVVGEFVEAVSFLVDDGICGWKKGCPTFPFGEGAFVTWKGAKRIGGMEYILIKLRCLFRH
jgi:hypothetical protein